MEGYVDVMLQMATAAAAAMGAVERQSAQRSDEPRQGQMGGIMTASFDDL